MRNCSITGLAHARWAAVRLGALLLFVGAATPAAAQQWESSPAQPQQQQSSQRQEQHISSGQRAVRRSSGQTGLGLDVMGSLPMGRIKRAAGLGIGGMLRLERPLQPSLSLTLRAGYIHHLVKSKKNMAVTGAITVDIDHTLREIPVLAGVKYKITPEAAVHGEIGVNFMKFETELKRGNVQGVEGPEDGSYATITLAGSLVYKLTPQIHAQAGILAAQDFNYVQLFAGVGYTSWDFL